MKPFINPYDDHGPWLRGNIHTHTTVSDGRDEPQEVVDYYARLGYDFLAITDHNIVTSLDSLDSHGMLLIHGEELTHPASHVVGIGLAETLPRGESTQEQIDLITLSGGLAFVCHPYWMGLSVDHIEGLRGHAAIELSNQVCFRDNGKGDSVAWWDALLSRGHHCWGTAVDDCHDVKLDAGKGWLMVGARDRSWPAIQQALSAGCFVASTGPRFISIQVEGRTVSVTTPDEVDTRFIGREASILRHVQSDRQAACTVPESEPFVRVEIQGRDGSRAWTQPFWNSPE